MTPTWKKYIVRHKDGSTEKIDCYQAQVSEDGKRVEFWMPAGGFIVRDGFIDPGRWQLVASFTVENIAGYVLKSEKNIT